MSLLGEIQGAALDPKTDLGTMLLKCKVLAYRLSNDPFKTWVEQELEGYHSSENLPSYRKVERVESYGHFVGGFGMRMENAPIPLLGLPKNINDFLVDFHLMEDVASYEAIQREHKGPNLRYPWPANLVAGVADDIYDGYNLIQAWRVVPTNAVVHLLNTVRNRVLTFCLEIESAAPSSGVADDAIESVPREQVSQIFNTYVLGGQANVVSASSQFAIESRYRVDKGDLEGLRKSVDALGVSPEDVAGLEEALREDGPPNEPGKFGEKTSGWLGRMFSKAAAGTWKIGLPVATSVLPRLIESWAGIGSSAGTSPTP